MIMTHYPGQATSLKYAVDTGLSGVGGGKSLQSDAPAMPREPGIRSRLSAVFQAVHLAVKYAAIAVL